MNNSIIYIYWKKNVCLSYIYLDSLTKKKFNYLNKNLLNFFFILNSQSQIKVSRRYKKNSFSNISLKGVPAAWSSPHGKIFNKSRYLEHTAFSLSYIQSMINADNTY